MKIILIKDLEKVHSKMSQPGRNQLFNLFDNAVRHLLQDLLVTRNNGDGD